MSRFVLKEWYAAESERRMWSTSEVPSRASPAGLPVYSHVTAAPAAAAAVTTAVTTRIPVDAARRRSDAP